MTAIIYKTFIANTHMDSIIAYLIILGTIMISIIICLGIAYIATPNYDDIYQTKQVRITKVIHVKGTDNYLVYDAAGKTHSVDTDDTTIKTNTKASAKLTYTTPRAGINKNIIKHYWQNKFNYNLTDIQDLTINLTPQMKHLKTEEWSFK